MCRPVGRRSIPVLLSLAALCAVSAAPAEHVDGARCRVDLSGDWDAGSWTSATSGHTGKLRATLTRSGPNSYRCVFRGTFLKIVPFRYPVTLHVTGRDGDRVYFRASRKLPLCGGTFTCSGSATACSFRANFASQDDRGVFTMRR